MPKHVTIVGGTHPRVIAQDNTAAFEEMLQRWRAVGNTESNLTGPRFKPQTSRFRDKRFTACIKFIQSSIF